MQNPQLVSGGLTSVVPILAFVAIIGGILVFAWMVRPTRVAIRTFLGTWHQNKHGKILPEVAEEKSTQSDAVVDGEKSAFDLSIFGPAGSVDAEQTP